jgi:hypothetical protein
MGARLDRSSVCGTVLASRRRALKEKEPMTPQDADAGACLMIVEAGAGWVSRAVDDGVWDASSRVLVAQQPDETPAELALRASRRAERIARAGRPLEAGVIVAADAASDEVFASRCQMARAMIRAMQGSEAPRLIFAAPSTVSDDGRHELLAIAGTLTTQLAGTRVEVSVRFLEPKEVSGTYPAVHAVRPSLDSQVEDVA